MIYFDNSATTKIFPEALKTYLKVSEEVFGNPSSLHQEGVYADQLLQQARQQVARLLEVSSQEVYFTSGGTEGDNWVIKGTAMEKHPHGKHIITSTVEHPAVSKSMKQLEKLGFEITYLPVNEHGIISVADLEQAIRTDTILVSLIAVNNEVGAVQPLREVGSILEHYPRIHYHVDAVQAVTEQQKIICHPRIDFLVLSAHKFNGPKGVGIVYKKAGRRLAPLLSGGGQESGERSSTENLPGIAATARALRMTVENKLETHQHEKKIRDLLINYLKSFADVRLFSGVEGAAHIICFALRDVRGEVMVHAFENAGIILSTTSACASKKSDIPATLHAMGVCDSWSRCAVRISLSKDNTVEEVETFKKVFDQLHKKFKKIQK